MDGLEVANRLPLPIMHKERKVNLPQNQHEFEEYMKDHKDEIALLHDFRFFEYNGFVHVIYHEATLTDCFDCIVRMKVDEFLTKIERSIELSKLPVEEIIQPWRQLWWQQNIWEPCGYNGTNQLFSSLVPKGDIVFFELADGTLQMCHRPMADGMAVLNTGHDTFAAPTKDGITSYGSFD